MTLGSGIGPVHGMIVTIPHHAWAMKSHLLYIHGFLSSPKSLKARQLGGWLAANHPDIHFHCPFLTPHPATTRVVLENFVEMTLPQPVRLVGSSLGGYWATWLAEKYDLRAVLINPAVQPSLLKPDYLDVELENYHTGDTYILTGDDAAALMAVDTPVIQRPRNYWLMVQTGDETLDYRLAVRKYAACKQLVESGGDHSFRDFPRWFPELIEFLESA